MSRNINFLHQELASAAATHQARIRSRLENIRPDTCSVNVEDAVLSRQVSGVIIHVCDTGTPAGLGVHWRLFLQLDQGQDRRRPPVSIELNCQALDQQQITRMFVTQHSYMMSSTPASAAQPVGLPQHQLYWAIPNRTDFTVAAAVQHLLDLRRDCYRLTERGIGCRFWCLTVIHDLEVRGWFPPGTANNAAGFVTAFSTLTQASYVVPAAIAQGTFY
ncbi:hypothetical protein FISHEDRAFT_63080 [Fistulina hepatica ATCC 64428]|uniref:DUF7770 domain-containing protein n=1 Tax=Fistulina hepatica ATCC 64428 TaxID=1128425 RepID=A0A0D6ZZB8_9AGAR|nr:hypothetical protein FISHEDRAFT_63080 [Fistulina hepatica ATCC 64428]